MVVEEEPSLDLGHTLLMDFAALIEEFESKVSYTQTPGSAQPAM